MRRHILLTLTATMALVAVAGADPTVTLVLQSPQQGQVVTPGATIEWTITAEVSTGDNFGLALVTCDLLQDIANPELIDLPQADAGSIDATMQNFDRPAGITNPGEGGAASGYVGVQRGTAGQMNLIQLGGAQNTFGEALPPGTGLGENATVIAGVGQSGPQVIVSGSFTAPSTCGTYGVGLGNPIANVMTEHNTPPNFSPVVQATIDSSSTLIVFDVGVSGDLDGDGTVDLDDLATLLANYGMSSGATYEDGDLDGDGDVDLSDLASLLANYGSGC